MGEKAPSQEYVQDPRTGEMRTRESFEEERRKEQEISGVDAVRREQK